MYASIASSQPIDIYKLTARDVYHDTTILQPDSNITLDSRKTHVTFYFQYPDSFVEGSMYYQLLPFDPVPVKIDKINSANYINLPGGAYRFQVTSDVGTGYMDEVKLNISKSFWQKSWFIPAVIGYIALLIGVVMTSMRSIKYRQELKLEVLRRKIASDLHDDLGGTLASIRVLAGMGKSQEDPAKLQQLHQRIGREVAETILQMRGMLWVVNPKNDYALDFFEKIGDASRETFQLHHIEFEMAVDIPSTLILPLESQHQLLLMLKEITYNTIKHAMATRVRFAIWARENWMLMQLEDNGRGFDPDQTSDGLGLGSIRDRVLTLGGHMELTSDASGTRYHIRIPLT